MHGLQLAVFPAHPPTRASTCTRADVQQDWGHHSLLSPDPSHRLSELARAPIPPKSQRHPGGDLSPGLKCSAGSISISPSTHKRGGPHLVPLPFPCDLPPQAWSPPAPSPCSFPSASLPLALSSVPHDSPATSYPPQPPFTSQPP